MYGGKTLFAQLMDFVPWTTFSKIVARYSGDHRVRRLSCGEQYRAMAFAQLTYRESLRDIETCLSVQVSKLYHMGFREPVRRSTLADANETRDWRIHAELAQRLIIQARKFYADDSLGLELTNTAYALDSTTIDLCLSVFPWAHFRATKAAVKMHTLLDLRGMFRTVSSMTFTRSICCFRRRARSTSLDRAYVDFTRLHAFNLAGAFFVTRAKSNIDAHRVYSAPTDRTTGIVCDQTIALDGHYTEAIPSICAGSVSGTPSRARHWCSSPISSGCRPRPSAPSTKAAGRSNCSSSGSSSIYALNGSLGRQKTQ